MFNSHEEKKPMIVPRWHCYWLLLFRKHGPCCTVVFLRWETFEKFIWFILRQEIVIQGVTFKETVWNLIGLSILKSTLETFTNGLRSSSASVESIFFSLLFIYPCIEVEWEYIRIKRASVLIVGLPKCLGTDVIFSNLSDF